MTSDSIDHLNTEAVNQAAYSFKKGLEVARNMMHHKAISRKGMVRVLDAILEFPLANSEPKFTDKAEEHLFILTLQCLSAKASMMQAVVANKAEPTNA